MNLIARKELSQEEYASPEDKPDPTLLLNTQPHVSQIRLETSLVLIIHLWVDLCI